MISYLFEASIGLAGFYGFYRLALHSEKLLSINRVYLLVTSALALVIPLLTFTYPSVAPAPVTPLNPELLNTSQAVFSLQSLPWGTVYLVGLVLAFLAFAIRLFKATRHLKGIFKYNRNQPAIVEIPGNEAYSFFNTIFIGKNLTQEAKMRDQVLAHETAHVQGLHFLDLLYFELLKCFLWFNPFAYFYAKSVKLQHEYIADQQVLTHTSAEAYERSLVKFTLSKIDNTLIAAFGQHPIEQRLKMIYKLNSNMMNNLKPLLSLPILAILFISFSCEEEVIAEAETPVVTEEIPSQGDVFLDELHPGEIVELIEEEILANEYQEKLREIELRALLKQTKLRETETERSLVQENEFKSRNDAGELWELIKKSLPKDQYAEQRRVIELLKIEKQKND